MKIPEISETNFSFICRGFKIIIGRWRQLLSKDTQHAVLGMSAVCANTTLRDAFGHVSLERARKIAGFVHKNFAFNSTND